MESPVLSLAEATQNLDLFTEETTSGGRPGIPSVLGADVGLTSDAETINGRAAIIGVLGTTVYELLSGHPIINSIAQ